MNRVLLLALMIFSGCSGKTEKKEQEIIEGRGIFVESGMVVSAHSESSGIEVSILRKGGNAVDAAVAAEFALAVCYPVAGNIGGCDFMVKRTLLQLNNFY